MQVYRTGLIATCILAELAADPNVRVEYSDVHRSIPQSALALNRRLAKGIATLNLAQNFTAKNPDPTWSAKYFKPQTIASVEWPNHVTHWYGSPITNLPLSEWTQDPVRYITNGRAYDEEFVQHGLHLHTVDGTILKPGEDNIEGFIVPHAESIGVAINESIDSIPIDIVPKAERTSLMRTSSPEKERKFDEPPKFTDEATDHAVQKTLTAVFYSRRAILVSIFLCCFICILCMLKYTLRHVRSKWISGDDRYMLQLVEATLTEIAVIGIALSILRLITTSDLIEGGFESKLFEFVFRYTSNVPSGQITTSIFTLIGNQVENLLVVYSLYTCIFAIIASGNFKWLRHVDNVSLSGANTSSNAVVRLLIARNEYKDRSNSRLLAGIDHKNFWFTDYFRNSLLFISMKLIRIPITSLIAIAALQWTLYPFHNAGTDTWPYLLNAIAGACATILIFVSVRSYLIHRKLCPADPKLYCIIRHQLDSEHDPDQAMAHINNLVNNLPLYKYNSAPEPLATTSFIPFMSNKTIFGTLNPHKHDDLFWFKRNGPSVLIRLAEVSYLILLILISHTLDRFDRLSEVWNKKTWYMILVFLGIIALCTALLPAIIYHVTYISSTGMMLRENILVDTLITSRSDFVKRIKYFIDGLLLHSTIHHIAEKSESEFHALKLTASAVDQATRDERDLLWEVLTCEHDGVLTRSSVFSFLNSRGISVPSEEAINDLMASFGVMDYQSGETEDEQELFNGSLHWNNAHFFHIPYDNFDLLIFILSDLLTETNLPIPAIRAYLESIEITNSHLFGIDELTLVLHCMGLEQLWSSSDQYHFLQYLSEGNTTTDGLSLPDLFEALDNVNKLTLGALNSAAINVKQSAND